MLDLTRTSFGRVFEKEVAVGMTIGAEGRLLQRVLAGGKEYAQLGAAAGGLDLIGFSMLSHVTPDEWPVVEEAVIPGVAPLTIQLSKGNLVPTMIRVYDVTAAADLTEGNPANAGEYSANDTTGLLTFNAAEADHSIVVYYRYYPTVLEAKMMWYEGQINRPSWVDYTRVGVGCGKSYVYTSEYDPTADFTTGALHSAANGFVSIGGGTAIPNAHVVSAPSASDAWLGIEFNI
jgi:hypothetical protein